jgi:ABC-type uncharacterized transport system permease subunit
MDTKRRVMRIILISMFAGGLVFLLMWLDKKHPLGIHVIRNGENAAAAAAKSNTT